jgi:glycosyltransferase involved in cell wall biosynthesis
MAALPNAELVLAGAIDADMKEALRSVPANVRVLGQIPSAELPAVFREVSAQILLSRNEGQAKALLEGAACGLPAIATQATGFRFDSGGAFQVEGDDLDSVVEALRRLRGDSALRFAMGAAARSHVERDCSWMAFRERCRLALKQASASLST